MSQNATIFVGWQDQRSRRWYVVARLVRSIAADRSLAPNPGGNVGDACVRHFCTHLGSAVCQTIDEFTEVARACGGAR
jgi:hypothetical protein